MQQYILRLDDASEFENKEKWERIEKLADNYGIKPLVGVIPQCEDPKLIKEGYSEDFWMHVREWQKKGWTIAQHGYTHRFQNERKHKAEFYRLSLEENLERIEKGYKMLNEHHIIPFVFFAPAHQFDINTIKALRKHGKMMIVSDGYAAKPYCKAGVTFIPAQTGSVKVMPYYKLVTFVYHPNKMKDNDFYNLGLFIKEHSNDFVSFPLESTLDKKSIADRIYYIVLFMSRKIREVISKIWMLCIS